MRTTSITQLGFSGSADELSVEIGSTQLHEFLRLDTKAKQARARKVLLEPAQELSKKITCRGNISNRPLQCGTEGIIFAGRRVPVGTTPETAKFRSIASDMGEVAAALNCVDRAAGLGLLKVEYYFHHQESNQFLFAHISPFDASSMRTLEETVAEDPYPNHDTPIEEHLRLAYKLAEAVSFLHSTGFHHKNITSSSVVILRRYNSAKEIDGSYLMGFDLIRDPEARDRPFWEFDVFRHPDQLQAQSSLRYIKTYDIYSLGVVLLEVGLWEPLSTVGRYWTIAESSIWLKELSDSAVEICQRVGAEYYEVVAWCLGLKGDRVVRNDEFSHMVLDPLECMLKCINCVG